ncbi:MAG: SMP-30/gluconolactonase/LRE family protein [Cystobacterineae bacterium]|nr:SMP-30/gluconolactonase/LRE family protein [Cystobacterineae bacterium]
MRLQKLSQALALALGVLACHIPGICKEDADCPQERAFCLFAENAKEGDDGVCTHVEPPVIKSFHPLEAKFGEELSIFGENFSAVSSENSVRLNNELVEIRFAAETELRVVIPPTLRCAGFVSVTVRGETAISDVAFSYLPTTVTVSTFAGSCEKEGYADGTGAEVRFSFPCGIAINAEGTLYVTDRNSNRIRKLTSEGFVSTLVGGAGDAGLLSGPRGITLDKEGNLYVADTGNNRIRKVTPQGVVTTFVGSGKEGNADGAGEAAQLREPRGITLDKEGNFYIADMGNNRICKVTPQGVVSTFAGSGALGHANGARADASFNQPRGLAIDAAGTLYVADTGNHLIRKLTSKGEVSTLVGHEQCGFGVADGTGRAAWFNYPAGLTLDGAGNLYIADIWNNRVRRMTPKGEVSTIAGSGPTGAENHGYTDGLGEAAQFYGPNDIALDLKTGNFYVADTYNHCIRKIVLE